MSKLATPAVEERESATDCRGSQSALEEMYPASKLVYLVLDREGPLTTKELATETHLTRRTVNQHTKYLRQADYVNSRPKLLNPNENVHALADRRDGTSTELGTELNTVGGDHDGQ